MTDKIPPSAVPPLPGLPSDWTHAVVLCHERGFRRIASMILGQEVPGRRVGHVFMVLLQKGTPPEVYDFAETDEYTEKFRQPVTGPRSALRELFRVVADSAVFNHKIRYPDAYRVARISAEEYEIGRAWAQTKIINPPTYQAAGWKKGTQNCVLFCNEFFDTIKRKVPTLCRILPWPFIIGLTIEAESLTTFGRRQPFPPDPSRTSFVVSGRHARELYAQLGSSNDTPTP